MIAVRNSCPQLMIVFARPEGIGLEGLDGCQRNRCLTGNVHWAERERGAQRPERPSVIRATATSLVLSVQNKIARDLFVQFAERL